MKKSILILISILFSYSSEASNIPPVAVLNSTPNQTWFYNLEEVVFNRSSSYDTDGYINYAKWYINGVYEEGGAYYGSMSICFALYGSPANGCYQLANGITTVTVGLEVRDNQGEWSTMATKTYTIQEHKGRKYFVKDHLGSVRVTVNRDGNVLGHDDYYPFGLTMPGRSSNSANPNDNYKFTGHERDDEANLVLDYMGARNYDPIIGRFLQIDPLSHKFPALSSYNYTFNNPLKFIDPDGMQPKCRIIKAKNTYRECTFSPAIDYGPVGNAVKRTETEINKAKISLELKWVAIEGAVKELLTQKIGIEFNSKMGKEAERFVTRELEKNESLTILNQVMGQFQDGTKVVFDNVAVDENGDIVLVNETKYNNAQFTKQQRRFFEDGESVKLIGKNASAGGIDGVSVDPNEVPTQQRIVDPSELEVRLFIDKDNNLYFDIKNIEIRFVNNRTTG